MCSREFDILDALSFPTKKQKLSFLESEIVGRNTCFQGPFGKRRMLYCDYTASGRALNFVEQYLLKNVLPYYGNTHTEASMTGKTTTKLREKARCEVRNFVHADDSFAVLFVGNGATGAIHHLFNVLQIANQTDVLIILGPYEHHSTVLPSITSNAEVVSVNLTPDGAFDLEHLESILQTNHKMKPIGLFSAVSNVTGTKTDTDAVTRLLHAYNGLCCWDYASGAPYLDIIAQNKDPALSKDAIVFSPHKFLGGVGTPGVLIVKKKLCSNSIPVNVGGGSVAYVTRKQHAFKADVEEREESGTPNIIGSIRLGILLALRHFISAEEIEQSENALNQLAKDALLEIPNLQPLGNLSLDRLPTFSFIVNTNFSNFVLHHHFISTLLNDLFGIQSRSGCMCAGPYSQTLLSMSDAAADSLLPFLDAEGRHNDSIIEEIMKPGYIRLSLAYFFKNKDVHFILSALNFIAAHGWKFLPCYKYTPFLLSIFIFCLGSLFRFNAKSGYWTFAPENLIKQCKQEDLTHNNIPFIGKQFSRQTKCLGHAHELARTLKRSKFRQSQVQGADSLTSKAQEKRWFLLPAEALQKLGK